MRLVSYSSERQDGVLPGILSGDGVLDLAANWPSGAGDPPSSVRELLERGETGLAAAREAAQTGGALPLGTLRLHPPVPDPEKFLCVGKNYRSHLDELRRNDLLKETPAEPTGFIKLNSCLVGQDARVARPPGITTLDYEPELVFVIGKPAYRVGRDDALGHIAGVTVLNDLTAREIQKREVASGTRFWTAKNMPGFGPVGPCLVTLDEIADPYDLWLTCTVNGQERLRVNTCDQIFRIGDIVEHFSRWMPLRAGDMFATGAPGGVAVGQPNAAELYLRPGDTVEAAIEGIAVLRTHIVAPGDGPEEQARPE